MREPTYAEYTTEIEITRRDLAQLIAQRRALPSPRVAHMRSGTCVDLIVKALRDGPKTVGELVQRSGVKLPTARVTLSYLVRSGHIERVKLGVYRLSSPQE